MSVVAIEREVRTAAAAASSGDDVTEWRAAIAGRPDWDAAPEPAAADVTRCQARDCGRDAVAYVVDLDATVCRGHALIAQRRLGRDAIAQLVDCAACLKRGPFGARLVLRGECEGRLLCADCADWVKTALEEGA